MAETKDVVPYKIGMVFMSVCAAKELPTADVVAWMNATHPTGIDSSWELSKDDFHTGEPNGGPCNIQPGNRKHWLLEC